MIDSPVLTELEGEYERRFLIRVLEGKFGVVPEEVQSQLGKIEKLESLNGLSRKVGTCKSLEEFKDAMSQAERAEAASTARSRKR